MALELPQTPPKWTHTPEEVDQLTKEAIAECKTVMDKVGKLSEAECNFSSVFEALAFAEGKLDAATEPLAFYQNVSASKELRDASNNAEKLVRDFGVEASMRLDVFQAKVNAEKKLKSSGVWDQLGGEEQRLVEKMVLDGTRAGLALPEKEREQLTELKKELSQVCLEFNKNFNEENGKVSFTLEELDGVPKDVISGYTKRTEGDKEVYDVTFKTPDIMPLAKFATNPTTRKIAEEANDAKLAVNVPLFEKAIELRQKIVKLLGYKNWAAYITEIKMVKTDHGVVDFLDDLHKKLLPVGVKDRDNLLKLKEAEHKEKGLPFDNVLYRWDYRYYDRRYVEESLQLDDSLVKEYFPVDVVVPAILNIYQSMLGVQFVPMKDQGKAWHPEAQQFSVWAQDAKGADDFYGFCYLDLYPRPGKYSHAAVWPLLPACDMGGGKKSYPLAAMVANLAKPTPEKPALMRHDDVVTFFHEMGHVFHGLLSRTKYSRFHGTNTARDFVEAPSQMLENWCWEPQVLKMMSSHYQTNKPLSDELIEKIIKSRYVNIGLFDLRQLFFGKFDITVHTSNEKQDYTELWNTLREKIALVKGDKPGPGQGSFGHLMGGYDAGYYGYLYSLVFAADMYATIFKEDPLDPARGAKYRKCILEPGGSRDELVSLREFLGREPNSDAFMKELFGSQSANL